VIGKSNDETLKATALIIKLRLDQNGSL